MGGSDNGGCGRIGWTGKIQNPDLIEVSGRDRNRIPVRFREAADREGDCAIRPRGAGSRPHECAAGVLIADPNIAGAFVEHQSVWAAIAIEIAGSDELHWCFVNESGAA